MILDQEFFNRDSLIVGKELLGKKLNYINEEGQKLSGIINEVEAYRGEEDEASHAYIGKTQRNRVMFETYGHVYIYFIYGMYNCMNFTAREIGTAGGILIRGLIPQEGITLMMKNRKTDKLKGLTDGPGKICAAFGIGKEMYGKKLCLEDKIYLEDIGYKIESKINEGPRIGISKGIENHWRFWFKE